MRTKPRTPDGLAERVAARKYLARVQGGYDQQLSYSDLGGTVYTVSGQGISNNQAMLGLGLRAKTGDVDIDLEYQATAANSLIQAHTIRGAIRLGF